MADYRLAAPYIEMGEGGLSRATTDTASSYPAPWVYKGVTGWHTNRGITYKTFESLASKLGYNVTPDNFFKMPDEVWNKIFKVGYWDPMGADAIKSDALAIYLVSWAWGSGAGTAKSRALSFLRENGVSATTVADGINALARKFGEQAALNKMLDYRAAWFRSLNQPANLKGWLNRLETYRGRLTELVKKKGV